ncbi:MAG: hypothetical protein KKF41_04650 [Actinobacteria bacterium]|nr:hypothetical protein [Actinomycetota bacterium]MBU1943499.1 hypothetical protein [Actinomycetota bacterium]MBU2686856.1 hypothetical protein [Actinomycetota bacterium]
MARLVRLAVTAFLVGMALSPGAYGLVQRLSGGVPAGNVIAQTSAPGSSAPGTPAPQPAAQQPVTMSPVVTIESLLAAVQAGDRDVVSTLTGGSGDQPGIVAWNSTDFAGFVGHTTFGRFSYCITHNDGTKANVHCDGDLWFTDPAGFPAVVTRTHWYVHGDFKLKASGDSWVITALPWYQESFAGYDLQQHPWPGDCFD